MRGQVSHREIWSIWWIKKTTLCSKSEWSWRVEKTINQNERTSCSSISEYATRILYRNFKTKSRCKLNSQKNVPFMGNSLPAQQTIPHRKYVSFFYVVTLLCITFPLKKYYQACSDGIVHLSYAGLQARGLSPSEARFRDKKKRHKKRPSQRSFSSFLASLFYLTRPTTTGSVIK